MRLIDADALKAESQKRQEGIERYGEEQADCFYSASRELSTEWWCVEDMIDNAPTIDLLDQNAYGYSIRFLVYVAAVMAKKGITAEQAAEIVTDMNAFVSFFFEEQKEITGKALEEIGKSQKSYTDWELRSE